MDEKKDPIQNIIISGGGLAIFNLYGAIREAERQGIWKYDSIRAFYGTSAGSMLSLIIALNYPWETIDKYLISRPWKALFHFNSINFYESFVNNGILDGNFFYEIFTPLLRGKDTDVNITFRQFYEQFGKELYFYSLNIGTATAEELSHKTRPDMRIIDGIYASSALPVLFKPFKYDGQTFMDGGVYSNYPIAKCLAHGCDEKHILGIRINMKVGAFPENIGLLEYIRYLVNMVLTYTQDTLVVRKNDICLNVDYDNFSHMLELLESPEKRAQKIEKGVKEAQEWIDADADARS
jgi:predicted acylesterase/phospholipase RssA